MTDTHVLRVEGVTLAYGERTVVESLDLLVPPGQITAIIGANACGKSTLLRAMSRLLAPRHGRVVLDGKDLHRLPTREVARTLGLLPQSPIAPEGITVLNRRHSPTTQLWNAVARRVSDAILALSNEPRDLVGNTIPI